MWTELKALAEAQRDILPLFDVQGRAEAFCVRFDGMLLDYSKTRMTEAARDALLALVTTQDVSARREAMFSGAPINETEGRAVLHWALRNLSGAPVLVDGQDVMPAILDTLSRMEAFADDLRAGRITGQGGAITDVVNIGIGGSHLGPEMGARALRPYHDGPRCHFVSNVDAADIADCLSGLDPARTLVIVASKTFTTIETMTNARTARDWMLAGGGDPAAQFAAVSTAPDKTSEFGIDPARVFGFGDWVGGRYSIWGPIGLSLMIAIGPEHFRALLQGAAAMDAHFRNAPPLRNMPVMLALTGLWHSHACGHATRAVLPYDQRLGRLPAYLQQLEMESNGKRVRMDGTPVAQSGPVVWGEPGTNGQHAFYQLIHQGTQVIPCEFLLAAQGHEPDLAHHHQLLVANCLAQSEALMRGRSLAEVLGMMAAQGHEEGAAPERFAAHRVFPGNRPSTTLIYDRLTPYRLGQIVALYEHRVFVEGVILGINSFDQWGVELGKKLALELEPVLRGEVPPTDKDGSTRHLVEFWNMHKD